MEQHDSHPNPVVVRRLRPADAEAYAGLRQAMLTTAPLIFLSPPADDLQEEVARVRARLTAENNDATLGAFDDRVLVGAVGLHREPRAKLAHRMDLWGMYVAEDHRRRGIGRRLVDTAIAHARTIPGVLQIHLGVTDAAPAALRLYQAAGFRVWGVEPRALQHGGIMVDERHMVLYIA